MTDAMLDYEPYFVVILTMVFLPQFLSGSSLPLYVSFHSMSAPLYKSPIRALRRRMSFSGSLVFLSLSPRVLLRFLSKNSCIPAVNHRAASAPTVYLWTRGLSAERPVGPYVEKEICSADLELQNCWWSWQ